MTGRGIGLIIGILALGLASPVWAQENLDAGKTPAQLYQSDCAICHKTTRGLSRVGGGLESFLREHYTASREAAAAIAGYLREVDKGPWPAERRRAAQPHRDEHGKSAEKKPGEKASAKPDEAKASEKKPGDAKTSEKKTEKPKTAEKKPAEAKSTKPSKPKTKDAEAGNKKPKDAKPVE